MRDNGLRGGGYSIPVISIPTQLIFESVGLIQRAFTPPPPPQNPEVYAQMISNLARDVQQRALTPGNDERVHPPPNARKGGEDFPAPGYFETQHQYLDFSDLYF